MQITLVLGKPKAALLQIFHFLNKNEGHNTFMNRN